MTEWKYPLWWCAVSIVALSFLFSFSPDYSIEYILGFDLVMWAVCGLIYSGEFAYNKLRRK
jgi:hypothetical protein